MLFPGSAIREQPITLLPPLARRLGATTPVLYEMLHTVPWLRSHLLTVISHPDRSGRITAAPRSRSMADDVDVVAGAAGR
jgi:hypothetical protein